MSSITLEESQDRSEANKPQLTVEELVKALRCCSGDINSCAGCQHDCGQICAQASDALESVAAERDGYKDKLKAALAENTWLAEKLADQKQVDNPLTVDELQRMDGQPVWVKAVDPNDSDTNYWAIVSANMHYSHKSGGVISTSTDGVVAVVAIAYFEDYSKTWLAYRRPPEAGEKE